METLTPTDVTRLPKDYPARNNSSLAELQPPKLSDEELEVLDLVVALGELHLALDDQTLERLDVIGQITSVEHIASVLIDFARVKYLRELFLRA